MKRWSWRRTGVLLLAVLLALGMSFSFVQGSVMTAGMAVAADGITGQTAATAVVAATTTR